MRDPMASVRRLRRASSDPVVLFLHRIRIGATVAVLILIFTQLG